MPLQIRLGSNQIRTHYFHNQILLPNFIMQSPEVEIAIIKHLLHYINGRSRYYTNGTP